MDEEFQELINKIKPLYHNINNNQIKQNVGKLIKELVGLSENDFQKIQRNELAKALLYKLEADKIYSSKLDYQKSEKQILPKKKVKPRKDSSAFEAFNKRIKKSPRTGHRQIIKPRNHVYKHRNTNCLSESQSKSETDDATDYERCYKSKNKCSGVREWASKSNCSNVDSHFLMEENIALDELREVVRRIREDKKPVQTPQSAGAMDGEKLIEFSREEQLDLASEVTRKNAELEALKKTAEDKQDELKKMVDKLEAQLVDALKNADELRLQSAQQHQDIQDSMARQIEAAKLEEEETRARLVEEYEKRVESLQSSLEDQRRSLEEQTVLVRKLQADSDEQARYCKRLQATNLDLIDQNKEANESREVVEHSLNTQSELLNKAQYELAMLRKRLSETERTMGEMQEKHMEEVNRLQTNEEVQKKVFNHFSKETTERLNEIVNQIKANLKQIESSCGDRIVIKLDYILEFLNKNANMKQQQQQQQQQQDILELRKEIVNWRETFQDFKSSHSIQLSTIKESVSRMAEIWKQKEAELLRDNFEKAEYIQRMNQQLGNKSTDEKSTDTGNEQLLLNHLSVELAKRIDQWQNSIREATNCQNKREQSVQVETEASLTEQHRGEMEKLRHTQQVQVDQLCSTINSLNQKIAHLSDELDQHKQMLAKEIETRRYQLCELSLARERERQEWNRSEERKLREMERLHEESLAKLKQAYADAMQTMNKLEVRKREEDQHKEQMRQLHEKLQQSQARITHLEADVREAYARQEQVSNKLAAEHRNELERLRESYQQTIWSLKEKAVSSRARARTAEAALKQREKMWTELSAQLQRNRIEATPPTLSVEAQNHLQETIEALRMQVTMLQKRIALLTEENESLTASTRNQLTTKSHVDSANDYTYAQKHEVYSNGDGPSQQTRHIRTDRTHDKLPNNPHYLFD